MEFITKTFRVFVSSIFSDMEEEWKALRERVFPRLEEYAAQHGCRFQAIDIRWGISDGAVLNQRSMAISLQEIFRCQRISPRLNFIMLLGDRYGRQPLPLWIPAGDFAAILGSIDRDEKKELLTEWYRVDKNDKTSLYELQPRQGLYADPVSWIPIEKEIRGILREAAQKLSFSPEQMIKYTASALEREIYYGALQPDNAPGQVFAFLRTFESVPRDEIAEEGTWEVLFDRDENGQIDEASYNRQQELKKRVKEHLRDNVFEYPAKWNDIGAENQQEWIDRLCDDVFDALSRALQQEVEKLTWSNQVSSEFRVHSRFCFYHGDAGRFVGREEALTALRGYVEGDSSAPFVVYGPAGVGKSALLARAVELFEKNYDQMVYRFIGVTPESTNIHPLLRGLCQQVVRHYYTGAQMEEDYREMLAEFPSWLASVGAQDTLIVFIDALDLLTTADNGPSFDWLPAELPPQVRFIVSIREDSPYRPALFKKIPSTNRLKLSALSTNEREELLDKLLELSQRTLQPEQRRAALEQFRRDGLPLYLSMSFEEVKRWWSDQQDVPGAADIYELFEALFRRLSTRGRHNPYLVANALGYILAAHNGLAEVELLDLLSANSMVMEELHRCFSHLPAPDRFPWVTWWQLYSDLQPYLREIKDDGTVLISPAHRSFSGEAVIKLQENKSLLRFHRELAAYFKAQPYIIDTPAANRPNYRKLSQLPYQQCHGHLWTELMETLCSFDFIGAKCAAGMAGLLEADYAAALQKMAEDLTGVEPDTLERLRAFARFVGEQVDFFHRFGKIPGFCAQQAFNAYLDGPVAEAAKYYLETLPREVCIILHHEQYRKRYLPNQEILHTMKGHSNYMHSVALSADGSTALSGSQDEPIFAWDVKTGRLLRSLDGHIGRVKALALSADGKTAVSAGWDKTLRVWEMESGECLNTIAASNDYIDVAALSADGKIAVTGDRGGAIGIWDIQSGKQLHMIAGHAGQVHTVTISVDGKIAFSAGSDGELKKWTIHTGLQTQNIPYPPGGSIHSLSLSTDGRLLISGGDDQRIRVWDTKTGSCLKEMTGHTGPIVSLAVSADGQIAVSASKDSTIRVWDIEKGECLKVLKGHSDYPKAVAVSAEGRIAVSVSDDQTVIVWNLADGIPERQKNEKDIQLEEQYYSMDGRVAVSGKSSKILKISTGEGAEYERSIELDEEIKVLNISPGGRIAVTAPWGNVLHVWDTLTGGCVGKLEGHSGSITAAALSLDGGMAISADRHGVLRVWDININSSVVAFPCRALAVAISPDGNFVIAGGSDKIIRVWHTWSGTCLRKWEGHTGEIRSIAVSLFGDLVFSTASDNTLRVWDVKKDRCIAVKGHHCEMIHVVVIGDALRVVDSLGDVFLTRIKNYLESSPAQKDMKELLDRYDNSITRLGVPVPTEEDEICNRDKKYTCSLCAYRITMVEAKDRGISTWGKNNCMEVYCYFFAKPVHPQRRFVAKCPHWVSYEVLNFEEDLKKG